MAGKYIVFHLLGGSYNDKLLILVLFKIVRYPITVQIVFLNAVETYKPLYIYEILFFRLR